MTVDVVIRVTDRDTGMDLEVRPSDDRHWWRVTEPSGGHPLWTVRPQGLGEVCEVLGSYKPYAYTAWDGSAADGLEPLGEPDMSLAEAVTALWCYWDARASLEAMVDAS